MEFKKLYLFIGILFLLFGFVWADSNGIWHKAEDVVGGIFGSDENPYIDFTFLGKVFFKKDVEIDGKLKLGRYTNANRPNCNSGNYGVMIYQTDEKRPYVCTNDGDKWKPLDSDYDKDGISDWNDWNDNDQSKKHINLTSENIKNGTTIFGVEGNYSAVAEGVDLGLGICEVDHDPGLVLCNPEFDYHGVTYKGVKVGNQCWLDKNLQYNVPGSDVVDPTYPLDGRIYSYEIAMGGRPNDNSLEGNQGICPSGWHVPSNDDWNELRQFLAGENYCKLDGTSCIPSGCRVQVGGSSHLDLPLTATKSYNSVNAVWNSGTRDVSTCYVSSSWYPTNGGVYGVGGYSCFSIVKNEIYSSLPAPHRIYVPYYPLRCIKN